MAEEKGHRKKKPEAGGKPEASAGEPEGLAEAPAEAAGAETVDVELLKAQARQRDEFLDLLRRTRAEFSNYRKRIERERHEWTERAVATFVLKLLPALDDFDRALAHADGAGDLQALVQGVRLVEQKLYDLLKSVGVEPFEPQGQPFDPAEHEAVTVEATSDFPDQSVSEVLLKGYRLHDRILRPARVKVARNVLQEVEETRTEDRNAGEGPGAEEGADDADV